MISREEFFRILRDFKIFQWIKTDFGVFFVVLGGF